MKLTALIALSIASAVNAGLVISYLCQSSKTTNVGNIQTMSHRVHYTNGEDGCQGRSSFDAYSGIRHPFEAFRKFCGDDGFCAKVNIFGAAGLHIFLDDKDVTLGNPDETQEYANDATARAICAAQGLTAPVANLDLAINQWNNAPQTKCK